MLNRYLWLTIGVLVGVTLLTSVRWHMPPAAPSSTPQADQQHLREQAWERIQPRLHAADNATQTLANQCVTEVEQFFAQRKAGVQGFAETLLSWQSKWALLKSKLPAADREGHRKFIDEQFAQYIFMGDDLHKVITQAVSDYLHGIEGIENTLLVAIRADLADFPPAALAGLDSDVIFQSEYARLLATVERSVRTDLTVDVVRESSSLVAGELAAIVTMQVATTGVKRLGISAGILGTGVASSTATFGIGLVVSVAMDTITDRVMHWYYNPAEKIATQVVQTLDRMQLLLIQGDAQTIGLRAEFEELGTSRMAMRHVALDHLIRQGS